MWPRGGTGRQAGPRGRWRPGDLAPTSMVCACAGRAAMHPLAWRVRRQNYRASRAGPEHFLRLHKSRSQAEPEGRPRSRILRTAIQRRERGAVSSAGELSRGLEGVHGSRFERAGRGGTTSLAASTPLPLVYTRPALEAGEPSGGSCLLGPFGRCSRSVGGRFGGWLLWSVLCGRPWWGAGQAHGAGRGGGVGPSSWGGRGVGVVGAGRGPLTRTSRHGRGVKSSGRCSARRQNRIVGVGWGVGLIFFTSLRSVRRSVRGPRPRCDTATFGTRVPVVLENESPSPPPPPLARQ